MPEAKVASLGVDRCVYSERQRHAGRGGGPYTDEAHGGIVIVELAWNVRFDAE